MTSPGRADDLILLIDIGNTHTHLGFGSDQRVEWEWSFRREVWESSRASGELDRFVGEKWLTELEGAAICSVVPRLTGIVERILREERGLTCRELTAETVTGVGIDYPNPETIGPDRLANAIAAKLHFGAPIIVVDLGTAVTFDVVDGNGNYVGGVIAPGLSAMTDYLHEKTALLPKIEIREPRQVIGKDTEQAMLSGAVHGYGGLIKEILKRLREELGDESVPVIATGGGAYLIAEGVPEIARVEPGLTLEGLRLCWSAWRDQLALE